MAYFAATVDSEDKCRKFAESLELDYPILSDPTKDTAKAFGVVSATRPFPQRWTFYIGPDGKVLHVDKEISNRSAGADVAAKLAELGVAEKSE